MQKQEEIIDWDRFIHPWFSDLMKRRMTQGYNNILLFCGGAGIGKSYGGLKLCETLDETFGINRVVFWPDEFIRESDKMRTRQWIMIDEPAISGILGKRTWYQEMQQALVDQLETFRFRILGTVLCCINRNLLDRTVREYLLHFMVWMQGRGFGTVYEIQPSQFNPIVRTPFLGEVYLGLPSKELRDAYEAKRAKIQRARYLKALERIKTQETRAKTFNELLVEARGRLDELRDSDGNVSVAKIRSLLHVGRNQAYDIKRLLDEEP